MRVSILLGSFGHTRWKHLARQYALPSAQDQGAHEVLQRHDVGGSLAGVRNALAEEAVGDWLCWVDADDSLGDGYVDAMRVAAESVPDVGNVLLVPAVQYVKDGRCIGVPAIPNLGGWPRVNECCIGTLVPRALFMAVGGFREWLDNGRELTSLEDFDLSLRCFDAGAALVHVPDAVYCASVNADSRNANQDPYADIWAEHEARAAR